MNIVIGVICGVLMILGAAELVRLLVFWWTRPDTSRPFTLVVAPESGEDCEALVRAAAERMRWMELKGPCRLVCVDRTGDQEIHRICRFLALQYPTLEVSKTEDLVYHILDES